MPKGFTENTLITFFSNWILFALSLGASIIIARSLGPEGKGIYTIAFLVPTLLITFTDIGIGPASIFHIGRKKYSPKKVFGADIIFSGFLSIVCILIGLVLIFFWGSQIFPGVARGYLLLSLLVIPFRFFSGFITDILLATHKIKKYNLVAMIQNFVFLASVVITMIAIHLNVLWVLLLQIFSIFISCIFLFYWTFKETNGINFKPGKKIFKDFILYGLPIYLISISWFLHLRIDTLLVNKFLLPAAVGVYSIAVGLAEKISSVAQSAGTILFPKICSEIDEKKDFIKHFTPLACRNIIFITILMSVFLFFIAPWLVVFLYSAKFAGAILPLRILLIGMISVAGSKIIASDLSGRRVLKPRVIIGFISVLINILLNLFLIPHFGIKGAAFATSISYTILFLLTILVYIRHSKNSIWSLLFIKKSDFKYYKIFLKEIKNKITKK